MKILPIGTQAFDVLRNDNAIYVDKTEHIYNLISNGKGILSFTTAPFW
jgi:hypothetical protein